MTSFTEHWLIYPKLAYMTMSMALYSTYVYTPAYFEAAWGVPTHGYGYISAISVLSLAGSLLWSRLGERMRCANGMMYICSALYAALFGVLGLEIGARGTDDLVRMALVTICYGGSSAFGGALSPLLDHLVLEYLEGHVQYTKELYGRQRLWSSIGHALIVVINGWGIQTYGYKSMFICLFASTAAFLLTLILLHTSVARTTRPTERAGIQQGGESNASKEGEHERTGSVPASSPSQVTLITSGGPTALVPQPANGRPSLLRLLGHPVFALFTTSILIAGFVRCVVGSFGPVYFKKILMMREGVYGMAMQTRLLPEMLCFFYGGELSKRYGSDLLMLIGQLAGIMRAAVYAMTPAGPGYSWVTYPAEMLKGLNNAAIMMAGPRMAHDIAPPGEGATALAIFHGTYSSLAMIVAGVAGGQVLRVFGDTAIGFRNLFMVTALSGLIPIIVMIILKMRRP